MDRKSLFFLIAGAFAIAAPALAQTNVVVETRLYSSAERKIGYEFRDDVNALWANLPNDGAEATHRKLEPILAYCDAQRRAGRRLVSVATTQEYERYMAENANGEPTEWIDIACPAAYKLKGYLHAGARQAPEAIEWLDRAIALAPYYPEAHTEKGFVLGQSGRLPEALESYRHALELAEAFPSAAHIKPLALRGQGWVLTEMGDLDGAQRAYEASLEIEPGNPLAKNELEYIAKLREKQP